MQKQILLIALALAAPWAVSIAEELPTPVDARLDTCAVPRMIHAGQFAYAPSPVTGSALFAIEYLTPDSLDGPAVRSDRFAADSHLPMDQLVFSDDYEGSGDDRGHLANSANHKRSQADQDATFVMTNIVPQSPKCNRGVWRRIEEQVRDLVRGERTAYVATVPIYRYRIDPPRATGPRNVMRPTHLAKAVLQLKSGQPEICRAWIVPNLDSADSDPAKHAASVNEVEAATQLDLFSWLDDETETRLESRR